MPPQHPSISARPSRPLTRSAGSLNPPVRGVSRWRDPQRALADPDAVLAQYLTWHEAEGHSRKTQLDYHKTLRPFFVYLKDEQSIVDLIELTLDHLRSWLVWLRNTPRHMASCVAPRRWRATAARSRPFCVGAR